MSHVQLVTEIVPRKSGRIDSVHINHRDQIVEGELSPERGDYEESRVPRGYGEELSAIR